MPKSETQQVEVQSRSQWRTWLEEHHTQGQSIWLVTYKKGHEYYTSYNDIVEEALCFGWIDSLPRKLDETRTMLLLAPRRKGSAWSKANKERVEKLTKAGQMSSAGLAKVEEAKSKGLWDKLNEVDALIIPADLEAALEQLPNARQNWDAFPPSVRRGVLEWITQAKRPETRMKRVLATAEEASQGRKVGQWRDK